MTNLPLSLKSHRVQTSPLSSVAEGTVRWAPTKSTWFTTMTVGAVVGGTSFFSWQAFALFLGTTAFVLLFGHSLGSHRKLIHDSYQCPRWLERFLIYCGVQVGLAGPLGLMRQHELRDYAQRLPTCHDYLRHGRSPWIDAWWQLHCDLRLARPPDIRLEYELENDPYLRFLERTWMVQQLPWAALFFAWGGWGFVFWGVCARVTAGVFGHWMIGYFAHNHGAMHFEVQGAAVQGRNIPLTSLLTMGECWHNNHHAFPGSARLGLYAGEWDPGWWALRLMARGGLVWGIKLPEHLPARPELKPVDDCGAAACAFDLDQGTPRISGLAVVRALLAPNARAAGLVIRWPAAFLSPAVLRLISGPQLDIRMEPGRQRLALEVAGNHILGLPALCFGFAQRSLLAHIVAGLLLPFALIIEALRDDPDALHLSHCPPPHGPQGVTDRYLPTIA